MLALHYVREARCERSDGTVTLPQAVASDANVIMAQTLSLD